MSFSMATQAPDDIELVSRDGLKLAGRHWHSVTTPSATVIIVHGFGEHSGRYNHVALWLTAAGMDAITFDQGGRGHSEGSRGHYAHHSDLMDDVEIALNRVAGPRFIYAHSFGGQVVLLGGIQRKLPILGAVITSPWIQLAFRPAAWRVALAAFMSGIWPTFTQGTRLDPERLSRDRAFFDSLPNPELSHRRISARAYFESVKAGQIIEARAADWTFPIFLAHGDSDPVTSLAATQLFFERCGAKDKTFNVYREYRHELHNDLGRENLQRDAVAWFAKRLPPS